MNSRKQLRKENNKKLAQWKQAVLERAEHKCEWCSATRYVQCHHIINRKCQELRFDTDNGIALCSRCHAFATGLAAHHNPIRIVSWLLKHRPDSYKKLEEWTNVNVKEDAKRHKGDHKITARRSRRATRSTRKTK